MRSSLDPFGISDAREHDARTAEVRFHPRFRELLSMSTGGDRGTVKTQQSLTEQPTTRDAAMVFAQQGFLRPFNPDDRRPHVTQRAPKSDRPVQPKQIGSLDAAFDAFDIGHGAVLSFHHHLRNGDGLLNLVLETAARRGLSGLTVVTSSVFPVHAPLAHWIRTGVVREVWTDYVVGPVGEAIMEGALDVPLMLQSHGGRARAISSGERQIDVAFIAAPRADVTGGATGRIGRNACGPLGYAMVDADHADQVVVVTDELQSEPLLSPEIAAARVDGVIEVTTIGHASGIVSGTTNTVSDPVSLAIAEQVGGVIEAAGMIRDGMSFQTGAGTAPLLAATEVGKRLHASGCRGDYISGGITGSHVALAQAGLFSRIRDVQCFDLKAVRSFRDNDWHQAMSASEYASPIHPEPAVDSLDVVILGAAEIDLGFDVNVTLGGHRRLIGGPGGHPDAAAGAALTLIATRTRSGTHAKIVEQVSCRTTPGCDVDAVVTEAGIAVNPARNDLDDAFRAAGLPIMSMSELVDIANCKDHTDACQSQSTDDQEPVVLVEYRDGSIIDSVAKCAAHA
jgi:citrate lyase subunit alpha/citrate CoA-transferase